MQDKNLKRTKRYWIINIGILLGFVLSAGLYYYGLHRSFWFDYEYTLPVYRRFLGETFKVDMAFQHMLDYLAYIPYKLFGCTLRAVRTYATLVYILIMFCCTIAVVWSFSKRTFEWYKLAIFAFIAVIINPGSSPFCGHYSPLFHQFPYDQHATPVLFASLSILLLCAIADSGESRYKKILVGLLLVIIFIGIKFTDFLYVVGFVAPVMCLGLVQLWKKRRHLLYVGVSILLVGMGVLRIISFFSPEIESWFVASQIGYGTWVDGKGVYGNNGFADLTQIWQYISNTMVELLALFNIDIIGRSMLSVNTLFAFLRIVLLIVILWLCFKYTIQLVKGDEPLDVVSIILSLGIFFNLGCVMFSEYGRNPNCIRYMTLILFYGAILLARHSDRFIFMINDSVNEKSKFYFAMFFCMCILLNMSPFWKKDNFMAEYEDSFSEVCEFIKENELGNGIGRNMYSTTLTVLGRGDYSIVEAKVEEGDIKVIEGMENPDNIYNYVINGPEVYGGFEEEVIYDCIGIPDEIYDVAGFQIYYYKEKF